ncbi:MAG: hypothetical protein GF317_08660 [Candidatus Lokiarchaeota archaeon]|nr:hypothetical protein [Candidatus Lokiarchaeota archaeon]
MTNVLFSVIFYFFVAELLRGILLQAFFWGLIDGLIGLFTYLRKKAFNLEKIKKILLINTYLDVVYVIIGIVLILIGFNLFLTGNGYGIIIQGLFLFVVDLLHYRHIKKSLI